MYWSLNWTPAEEGAIKAGSETETNLLIVTLTLGNSELYLGLKLWVAANFTNDSEDSKKSFLVAFSARLDSRCLAEVEDQERPEWDAGEDGQREQGLPDQSSAGGGLCEGDLQPAHRCPPAGSQWPTLRDTGWVLPALSGSQAEIFLLFFQGQSQSLCLQAIWVTPTR